MPTLTSSRVLELPFEQSSEPVTVRPLMANERLALVDVLRGVAILGVLVAYTLWSLGTPPAETFSRTDVVIDTLGSYLVDTKFISIFAFLFGVGTAQQWRRAEGDPRRRTAIHVRRMLFLLAAGVVHATLIRNGDILAPYAILGLVLLGARRVSDRQLVVAIIVLALLPYAMQTAYAVFGWKAADRPGAGSDAALWTHYWTDNFVWVRYWALTNPLFQWPRVLAVMLAGVLADRARLMPRIAADRRLAWKILGVALSLAVIAKVGSIVLALEWSEQRAALARGIVFNQVYYIAAWSLAAVYVALFALICQRPGWPARLQWLRAVGRMAFTNYLLQGLLVVPVCLAFSLFDTVTPTRGLLLALGVMAIQIPFSVWWLNRFEYGPVEWLWRRVTYGSAFAKQARHVRTG
jgi:uncharacterized protein